jgi:hypothetical protein
LHPFTSELLVKERELKYFEKAYLCNENLKMANYIYIFIDDDTDDDEDSIINDETQGNEEVQTAAEV